MTKLSLEEVNDVLTSIGIHKLRNIDIKNKKAICDICGTVKIVFRKHANSWQCITRKKEFKNKYRGKNKKDKCERCEFVPEYKSQLDIHHKDGNHRNNDIGNLETLCANCHRLVHASS